MPPRLEDLVELPGVGRKTANVVLGNAFGIPGITVDTHFGRLARRFGWTEETDPVKAEHEVGALFPKKDWTMLSPPPDLARPPGLPRPQPRLRRLPGGAAGARRTARGRPTRSKAAQAREDRGPRVRRLVARAAGLPAARLVLGRLPGSGVVDAGAQSRRRRGHPGAAGAQGATRASRPAPRRRPAGTLPDVTCPASAAAARSTSPRCGDRWWSTCSPSGAGRAARSCRTTSELHRKGRGKVEVLGVDYLDTQPDQALELVKDTGVTYPLLADPGGDLRAAEGPRPARHRVRDGRRQVVDVSTAWSGPTPSCAAWCSQQLGVTLPA